MADAGPRRDDDGRPSGGRRFQDFWKTLPGVLTGLAALVTAIGGILALWLQFSGGPSGGPEDAANAGGDRPTASSRATAGASDAGRGTGAGGADAVPSPTSPSTGPSPSPSSSPRATPGSVATPASGSVLYRDRVEMRDADFVDLETGRLGNPPPNDDFYLHGTDQIVAPYGMTAASGPITRAACVAALTDRQDQSVTISKVGKDQWLCVQTREGHLGGITIARRAGPGSPSIVFEYVLWN